MRVRVVIVESTLDVLCLLFVFFFLRVYSRQALNSYTHTASSFFILCSRNGEKRTATLLRFIGFLFPPKINAFTVLNAFLTRRNVYTQSTC